MNKRFFSLLILLLIFAGSGFSLAAEDQKCFPNYICGDWTDCQDGFRTRTCTDTTCGERDLTERSFCTVEKCTPKVECAQWGPCIYTEKTDNLIKGKVGFGGYRTRVCDDVNDCIPRFIQEGPCEDSYKLQLSPISECGQNLLAVIDPSSDRKIAKINLDRWKQGKFDLSFVQGDKQYCPSCFNAVKDGNEEGVDCGGSCKSCGRDYPFLLPLAITLLWLGSAAFIFLSVRQYVQLRKPESIFIEEQQ